MVNVFVIARVLLLINSLDFVLSQQNNLSQCRIVCDEEPTVPDRVGPSSILSRGKMGQKGEKGDVGSPGQKGESNKHVISKLAKKFEILENKVQEQSEVIAKLSEMLQNSSVLMKKRSEITEINSDLIKNLSETLISKSELIEDLSKCETEQIENASSNITGKNENSTTLLRHNEVVEYKCNDGYFSKSLPIRKCSRGKVLPSFQTQPFTCIDVCSQTPCKNNGTCNLDANEEIFYKCFCQAPYYGDNCEKKHCIDDDPCLNNGECNPTEDGIGYNCTCLPKYYGEECQYEYCKDSNPCSNGGECISTKDSNSYKCSCAPKYYGDLCEYEYCQDSNPCLNDGVCSTTDRDYSCQCKYGYGGVNCEIDDCFRFEVHTTSSSFHGSKRYCNSIGGEIVSRLLGNDGLNYHSKIRKVVSSQRSHFWVGVNDEAYEGSWKFEDGQPATNLMFSWGSGQPDNSYNEDCVYFNYNWNGLNDISCGSPHVRKVLCQLPTGYC